MKLPAGILVLIAIGVVIYGLNRWLPRYISARATGKGPGCLVMLGNTTRDEENLTYIIGSIKNNCDYRFDQVTVLFKLDRVPGPTENLPEAVAYAYVSGVKPGETREFKTALPVSKNSTYRFDGINAY
jgi:hypothetical protein